MTLNANEIKKIADLLAKADREDMSKIAKMFNEQQKVNTRSVVASFEVGEDVKFTSSKTGRTITGKIRKIKRKMIEVTTETTGTWNVPATMLEKV